MKNRTKVIFSLIMVVFVLCCTLIPTFALGYGNPTDESNAFKYQPLSAVNLDNGQSKYSMYLDNHYGENGTYTQTDTYKNSVRTKVTGSSTKKLAVELTPDDEYNSVHTSLAFRNITYLMDRNSINPTIDTGFHAINDLYLCFDGYIGSTAYSSISFDLDGYALQDDGSYKLETKSYSFDDIVMDVDNIGGVLVNYNYACRIRVDTMLNILISTRPENLDFYKNANGYILGGVRNLKLSITSLEGSNDAIFLGIITTARGTWGNGNHSYRLSQLANIVIPSANAGYDAGYSAGYDEGYDIGYDEGFEDGSTYEGDGYQQGYNDGYSVGFEHGEEQGYDLGLDDGVIIGYESGVQVGDKQGYNRGYGEGYEVGNEEGYNEGYNKGSSVPSDVGQFLTSSIGSFLSTPIFGDGENSVSLGMLLLIPITIPIVIMFLKLFAGG